MHSLWFFWWWLLYIVLISLWMLCLPALLCSIFKQLINQMLTMWYVYLTLLWLLWCYFMREMLGWLCVDWRGQLPILPSHHNCQSTANCLPYLWRHHSILCPVYLWWMWGLCYWVLSGGGVVQSVCRILCFVLHPSYLWVMPNRLCFNEWVLCGEFFDGERSDGERACSAGVWGWMLGLYGFGWVSSVCIRLYLNFWLLYILPSTMQIMLQQHRQLLILLPNILPHGNSLLEVSF